MSTTLITNHDESVSTILNQLSEIDGKIRQHQSSSSMGLHALLHDPVVTVLWASADRLSAIDQLVSVIFQTEEQVLSISSSTSSSSLELADGQRRRQSARTTDKVTILDSAFTRLSDVFLKSTSLHLRLAVCMAFKKCRWALKYVINRVDIVRPVVEVLVGADSRVDDLTRVLALRVLGYFGPFFSAGEEGDEDIGTGGGVLGGWSFNNWFQYDIVFGVVDRLLTSVTDDNDDEGVFMMVALQSLASLCEFSAQMTQYCHPILKRLLAECSSQTSFNQNRVKLELIYRVIGRVHICEPGFNLELLDHCFKSASDNQLCIALPYLVNVAVRDVVLSEFIVENVVNMLLKDSIDQTLYDIATRQLYKISRVRPYTFIPQRLFSMGNIVTRARFVSCIHVLQAIEFAIGMVAPALPRASDNQSFISLIFLVSSKCTEPSSSSEFRVWGCRLLMKCYKLFKHDLKQVLYPVLNVLNSAELFKESENKRLYLANMLADILVSSNLNSLDVVTLFCNNFTTNRSNSYEHLFVILRKYLRGVNLNDAVIPDLSRKITEINCRTYKMVAQKTEVLFLLCLKTESSVNVIKVCSAMLKQIQGKSLWFTYRLSISAARNGLHQLAIEGYQHLLAESGLSSTTRIWFTMLSEFSAALVLIQTYIESQSQPVDQRIDDQQLFNAICVLERMRHNQLKHFELLENYSTGLHTDYLDLLIAVIEYVHTILSVFKTPGPSKPTRIILSKLKLANQKVTKLLSSGLKNAELAGIMRYINHCQMVISRNEEWTQVVMKQITMECRQLFKVPSFFFEMNRLD